MLATIVHDIDPVAGNLGGLYIWWYGLSYTFGLLGMFAWLRGSRERLGLSLADVYRLTSIVALGVVLGGRLFEVFWYEWAYYGDHLWHIPAIWLGGMSTHGILMGGVLALALFSIFTRRSFLELADALVIPTAFIMGVGRLGNFIDGQIVGAATSMPWGVDFPNTEGFRHPVVLYDGLKNLLLIPVLLLLRRKGAPRGVVLGAFLVGYGGLRIFVDFFREYRTTQFGLPPGQLVNATMALLGVLLIAYGCWRQVRELPPPASAQAVGWGPRLLLAALLLLPAIIPSDWTQDVPVRYGARHPGLEHSTLYPPIPSE